MRASVIIIIEKALWNVGKAVLEAVIPTVDWMGKYVRG
jgi:hypothetical protein